MTRVFINLVYVTLTVTGPQVKCMSEYLRNTVQGACFNLVL